MGFRHITHYREKQQGLLLNAVHFPLSSIVISVGIRRGTHRKSSEVTEGGTIETLFAKRDQDKNGPLDLMEAELAIIHNH